MIKYCTITIRESSAKLDLGEERNGGFDDGQSGLSETIDPWEECGCVLWDLAASKTQAEVMVNNLVLEVLLANLHVSKSFRVKEICLGIIGNLACHEVVTNAIISQNGLIETVVEQLFLDDSSCLLETFRLLAVALQGSAFASWAEALLPDQIILRILWIVGNTMNSTLFEKCIDFLLTVVDNEEVASMLLQPLMKLGLLDVVVSLLTCEIEKSGGDAKLERSDVLNQLLRLIEALSAVDICSQVMSSNEQLLNLVCGIVKLPDKFEAASSCISAVMILANLLPDGKHLILGLSKDFHFLQGLFDILPLVSDDSQARNALWCTLARLLIQIDDNNSSTDLHQFASIFLEKASLIEEDLESHSMDKLDEDVNSSAYVKLYGVTTSLSKIAGIMEKWITGKASLSGKDVSETHGAVRKAQKFVDYCRNYGL
ncbi:Protein SAAL1 [Ananas comosus]|uniref:Protein SAAL1 n=1 Tax=Ananas comosus TaxID=4615 RepID=A0A199UNE1_ANACO|nr:Protein SAAL1 [Ananas comosus]